MKSSYSKDDELTAFCNFYNYYTNMMLGQMDAEEFEQRVTHNWQFLKAHDLWVNWVNGEVDEDCTFCNYVMWHMQRDGAVTRHFCDQLESDYVCRLHLGWETVCKVGLEYYFEENPYKRPLLH